MRANFDGIVGPTHFYGGLSYGNVASMEHESEVSNPKAAAIQGLNKMKFLADRGFLQGVIPPQLRPRLDILRQLGFTGTDKEILKECYKKAPELLQLCSSSSSMWCANAATATLSKNQLHITPANLTHFFHRSLETEETAKILKTIFSQATHHAPLPPSIQDEGAANYIHLDGVHLFVHGKTLSETRHTAHFAPRQTLEAQKAIVRNHQLDESRVVFAKQSQTAIDHGVFHNDVIAMGTDNILIVHESAYENQSQVLEKLQNINTELQIIEISESELPLREAVNSYFFNSQLLNSDFLLCPQECRENPFSKKLLEQLGKDVHFIDIRQSMHNGGGPACLRLQVPLIDESEVNPTFWLTEELYEKLITWIDTYYRDHLSKEDLQDISLYEEAKSAQEALNSIVR